MAEALKFVIVGHVDHGKSTLIGRLLADTDTLNEGALDKVRAICEQSGKEFEYAFLLDALAEEQEQGITIDTTKIEFKTKKRRYTIIDAPGHKEFLKNMVTGASHAEAAVLIIDAKEGVREQSRRHAYLLSLLGIRQVSVVVNKMDMVDFSQETFDAVVAEIKAYLANLNVEPIQYIPLSAKHGDNVTQRAQSMPWYTGPTFLEAIDAFESLPTLENNPLRMPIQDVYKFDDRRIVAGTIEAGTLKVGDTVVLHPSQNTAKVKSIEHWAERDATDTVRAGQSVGITLDEEYYFKRGEVITHAQTKPIVRNLLSCHLFWMGKNNLVKGKKYVLKLNTQEIPCEVHTINRVIDAHTLETIPGKNFLSKHDVGNIVLRTKTPLVFDPFDEIPTTGRFVIVDELNVCGGGIIEQPSQELRERQHIATASPNVSPHRRLVNLGERHERQGHKGCVVWVTGLSGSGKGTVARQLERTYFDQGKNVFLIDSSNLRMSLTSDLDFSRESRFEQVRRMAEVANLMLNAGFIVIVSIVSPFKEDRAYAREIIGADNFAEIYVDTPLEVCKKRDPRGIYTRAQNGELKNVPGVHFEYEHSDYDVYALETNNREINEQTKELVEALTQFL